MNLASLFIKRPIATALMMLAILLFGIVAYRALPVSDLPSVDFPTIQVTASLPGASAETMAASVATPLEKQFSAIPGLNEMSSTSQQSSTSIALQFDLSRNIDGAAGDVQTAISAASGQLPPGMPSPPTFQKVNPADSSIINLALSSDTQPLSTVDYYAEDIVGQQISMISGVAQVNVRGAQKYAVRVQLNPLALAARGIGVDTVEGAIRNGNVNLPSGVLWGANKAYTVQTTGQLTSAAAYKQLIVADHNGAPVRLGDVADVLDSVQVDKNQSWVNGVPAVLLSIMKQPGTNTIDTVNRIMAMMPKLQQSIPPSIKLRVEYDRSVPVRASVNDVKFTLILTMFLVVMVIFLFLKNLSATLIPSLALPFTIVGTFAVMYALHYSLDNLSLLALTLSVGFVVDDAIVMLENIVRHLEMGKTVMQAALDGSKEISFTILSMTLSLSAVFIPFLFMGGILGRLLHEFAVTIGAAILISGFVSLTLTPMLCSRFIKHESGEHGRLYNALEGAFQVTYRIYDKSLKLVLRHKILTMLGAAAIMAVTVQLFLISPTGFFPVEDLDQFAVRVQAAQGISWDAMKQHELDVMKVVDAVPETQAAMAFAGGGAGNTGAIYDHIVPRKERKRSVEQIIADLRPRLAKIPGVEVFLQNPPAIQLGAHGTNSLYQVALEGTNPDELYHYAPLLAKKLSESSLLKDVNTDMQTDNPQVNVVIDRDKASSLGITAEQIEDALYTAYGQRQLSIIYSHNDNYYVITELQPQYQINPQTLSYLYIHSSSGTLVPLSAVTRFEENTGPLTVNHIGQFPAVTISFDLKLGGSLGPAVAYIQDTAQQMLPRDITPIFQGTAEVFQDSMRGMGLLLAMAVLVIYIVLGILYESFIHPLTILSGLPAAAFGALLTLWIFHVDLNIYSIVGIIMLVGIVKKNAIMMIDFALQAERSHGMDPEQAIYQGALVRFRPIMMTTFCALVGTLPIAIGAGAGAESRRPLGLAVVGGLLFSQVLTLYMTPVVYIYMDRFQTKLGRKKQAQEDHAVATG
jgi:HAE1 family hydrophobic/amphiphilic exporter-1